MGRQRFVLCTFLIPLTEVKKLNVESGKKKLNQKATTTYTKLLVSVIYYWLMENFTLNSMEDLTIDFRVILKV